MKVLYIGHYRDGTGYGHAACDYILSFLSAGIDVVARPIKLNNLECRVHEKILEAEKKSGPCDVVIQHTLPHLMDYSGKFDQNIGMFASETSDFSCSNWSERLNLMDGAWVFNEQMKVAARKSGVKIPLFKVPHATDVSKFERSYKQLGIRNDYKDSFIFYTISELNKRKNIPALIKAFHLEFATHENVELLIKLDKPEISSSQCKHMAEEDISKIKQSLKLYSDINKYKKEILICDRITEESIYRLHNSCDCFVSTSYGEAWCIPAFDAMGFGKTPIVTNCTGFKEYINEETGWLVDCIEQPVFGMTNTFDSLYTGKESWSEIVIYNLRKCMREAYEDYSVRMKKSQNGMSKAYDFSHEKVGDIIKKVLYGQKERNV